MDIKATDLASVSLLDYFIGNYDMGGGNYATKQMALADLQSYIDGRAVQKMEDEGLVGAGIGPYRGILANNLAYYVDASSGDDGAGDGSSGAPWQTIQYAIEQIKRLDHYGFTVTLYLADGTYTQGGAVVGAIIGNVEFQIVGNDAHPENVIISVGDNEICWFAKDYGAFTIRGMTLQGGSGAIGIQVPQFGIIDWYNVIFGDFSGGIHVDIRQQGSANALSGYAISGSASRHLSATQANINLTGITASSSSVAMSGTLAFDYFAQAVNNGCIQMYSTLSFSGGTITGTKWLITTGGAFDIAGGGFPDDVFAGDTAGEFGTGGGCNGYFSSLGKLTVSQLGSAAHRTPGSICYATDGRKSGEGAGSGTGILAYCDEGGDWYSVDGGALSA